MGHASGGVCPFGVNEGVAVYPDESLRKFDTVCPAAGNGHTAVKLTLQELEAAAGAMLYVVVEELIPEMSQGQHSNVGTVFFAVGFSVMMVLDVALG